MLTWALARLNKPGFNNIQGRHTGETTELRVRRLSDDTYIMYYIIKILLVDPFWRF